MIARISSGASFYGILAYNKMKVDGAQGRVIACNKMTYASRIMERGEIPLCLHTFERYAALNGRVKKPVFHVSLNPHPDDRLSDDDLERIARQYMERMGYGEQPYIVYKHEDIRRTHLHIVASRIREDGTKVDHNNEGRRSKPITEEIEREWGLHPGEGSSLQEEFSGRLDYREGNVKQRIRSIVLSALKNYRFASVTELGTLLGRRNVAVEEVSGEVRGKPYAGILYGALDDRRERVGKPFKSSLFGREFGHKALQKRFAEAREFLKSAPEAVRTRERVREAMSAPTLAAFAAELARAEIEVVVRQNDQGRIYGITFIDHRAGLVANGSRLGKEFAARNLDLRYGSGAPKAQQILYAQLVQEESTVSETAPGTLPETREANTETVPLPDTAPLPVPPETPQREPQREPRLYPLPEDTETPGADGPGPEETGASRPAAPEGELPRIPRRPRGWDDIEQAIESLDPFSILMKDAMRPDYDPDEQEAARLARLRKKKKKGRRR